MLIHFKKCTHKLYSVMWTIVCLLLPFFLSAIVLPLFLGLMGSGYHIDILKWWLSKHLVIDLPVSYFYPTCFFVLFVVCLFVFCCCCFLCCFFVVVVFVFCLLSCSSRFHKWPLDVKQDN